MSALVCSWSMRMVVPSASNLRGHWSKHAGRIKQQRADAKTYAMADLRAAGHFCPRELLEVPHEWFIAAGGKLYCRHCVLRHDVPGVGASCDRAPALVITLTRQAPRALDDDNLRGALKSVRDGIADALGIDDRDPRVTWDYGQAKGEPQVRVTIERVG